MDIPSPSRVYKSILIAVTAVIAQSTEIQSRICGNEPSAEDVLRMEADFTAKKVNIKAVPQSSVTVNVYFHVIYKDTTIGGGYVPDQQIRNQINVLNEGFVDASITFVLARTTRTLNPFWFDINQRNGYQTDMKTALREGGAGDLNIYTVGSITDPYGKDLFGYATFPSDYFGNEVDDGVVVKFTTLPGGSQYHSNLGRWDTGSVSSTPLKEDAIRMAIMSMIPHQSHLQQGVARWVATVVLMDSARTPFITIWTTLLILAGIISPLAK